MFGNIPNVLDTLYKDTKEKGVQNIDFIIIAL